MGQNVTSGGSCQGWPLGGVSLKSKDSDDSDNFGDLAGPNRPHIGQIPAIPARTLRSNQQERKENDSRGIPAKIRLKLGETGCRGCQNLLRWRRRSSNGLGYGEEEAAVTVIAFALSAENGERGKKKYWVFNHLWA
ncbi:hypothetical protein R6Q57_000424 [Mikania cordata]